MSEIQAKETGDRSKFPVSVFVRLVNGCLYARLLSKT